jgi:hypothetical protein
VGQPGGGPLSNVCSRGRPKKRNVAKFGKHAAREYMYRRGVHRYKKDNIDTGPGLSPYMPCLFTAGLLGHSDSKHIFVSKIV